MKRILLWILGAIGLLVFAGLGLWLNDRSFERIHEMRQLERVPRVDIGSVLPGEVNVSGRVAEEGPFLTAPRSGRQAAVYRYKVEEERIDSDGDTYWATIRDEVKFVKNFWIEDESGRLEVLPVQQVDFQLDRDYRQTEGSRRYSEYRVEPGDEIFVFGYADPADLHYRVNFAREGSYRPILSDRSAFEARSMMAERSALYLLGGLAALAMAVLLLLWLLRVHHSAACLTGLSLVMISALLVQGVLMMQRDLEDTVARTERSLAAGTGVAEELLADNGVSWDGDWELLGSLSDDRYTSLPDTIRAEIEDIRVNLARAVYRANANLARFPENLMAASLGLSSLEPPPLPDEAEQNLAQLEANFQPTRLLRYRALIFFLIAGLITYLSVRYGFPTVKTKRLIENLPTSPVEGVVYGLTEIKGEAALEEEADVLTGPVSKQRCIYYWYQEKKKKGDSWKVVREEERHVPFLCQDDTDVIRIRAAGRAGQTDAEFIARKSSSEKQGKRKYVERRIELGDPLYVLGTATIDQATHDRLEITDGDDESTPFIISNLSERRVMFRKAFTAFALFALGVVATVGVGLSVAGTLTSFGPVLYGTTTSFSLAYLIMGLCFLYYNDLVFLHHRVERNWANIDVALKKRFDLITSLADVVEGYLDHERELQSMLSQARTAHAGNGAPQPDHNALAAEEKARDTLIATVEDHPELKGQELVQDLMHTLREVENDVALMREGYNDIVERYNTRCQKVPEVLIARLFDFHTLPHYEAHHARQPSPPPTAV